MTAFTAPHSPQTYAELPIGTELDVIELGPSSARYYSSPFRKTAAGEWTRRDSYTGQSFTLADHELAYGSEDGHRIVSDPTAAEED